MTTRWFKSKAQRDREALEEYGRVWMSGMAQGIKDAAARRAAGLPPKPISAEALAHAELVARRSFPFLYEDDESEN